MKQLVVSSIIEVIDKIESVTDAVKQWWLPRASLNEELIDTFVVILRHWRFIRVSNPGRDRIRVRFMRQVFRFDTCVTN